MSASSGRALNIIRGAPAPLHSTSGAYLICFPIGPPSSPPGLPQEAAVGSDVWALFRPVGDFEEALAYANVAIFLKKPFSVAASLAVGGAEQRIMLKFRFVDQGAGWCGESGRR